MKTLLFFDTETTGFPRSNVPAADPSQAHLVQIAAIETSEDGFIRNRMSLVVNPGVPIPQDVVDIHGISAEIAVRDGVQEAVALNLFLSMMGRCDLIVGHGVDFDMKILSLACERQRVLKRYVPTHCTKSAARLVVNAPASAAMQARGNHSAKAPTLGECVNHFFGAEIERAHDAYADTEACMRVFFEMVRLGHRFEMKVMA